MDSEKEKMPLVNTYDSDVARRCIVIMLPVNIVLACTSIIQNLYRRSL